MECPVCYMKYNDSVNKPKIASCGHTICEGCIREISKCCICAKEFPVKRRRGRVDGWFYSREPHLHDYSMEDFKDNYALKDLIAGNMHSGFSVCKETQEAEQFYCQECAELVCLTCLDKHNRHSFMKVNLDMYKTSKSVSNNQIDLDKRISESKAMLENLTKAKQENEKIINTAPAEIDKLFDQLIVDIMNSRELIKETIKEEMVAKSETIQSLEKTVTQLNESLIQIKDQMACLFNNISTSGYQNDDDIIAQADSLGLEVVAAMKQTNNTKTSFYRTSLTINPRLTEIRKVCEYARKTLPLDILAEKNPFVKADSYDLEGLSWGGGETPILDPNRSPPQEINEREILEELLDSPFNEKSVKNIQIELVERESNIIPELVTFRYEEEEESEDEEGPRSVELELAQQAESNRRLEPERRQLR